MSQNDESIEMLKSVYFYRFIYSEWGRLNHFSIRLPQFPMLTVPTTCIIVNTGMKLAWLGVRKNSKVLNILI